MIKQSVINTFNRVGIDYKKLQGSEDKIEIFNRFSGEGVITNPLLAKCVNWVYETSNDYEQGIRGVNVSDFDRVRHFILAQNSEVYMTCID